MCMCTGQGIPAFVEVPLEFPLHSEYLYGRPLPCRWKISKVPFPKSVRVAIGNFPSLLNWQGAQSSKLCFPCAQ